MTSKFQTYTGKGVDPFDLKPEDVDIRDIAHALSLNCRFNGHCKSFYSVAEHSWLASFLVPVGDELAALLHDASEAYISDIVRPVKQTEMFAPYRELEDQIQRTICYAFGLNYPNPESVKRADNKLLAQEAQLCLPFVNNEVWGPWIETFTPPCSVKPYFLSPEFAERMFLERFTYLTGKDPRKSYVVLDEGVAA